MKYQKTIESIKKGKFSRADLVRMRENAAAGLKRGDQDARAVIDAIDLSTPADKEIVFMGFCPGANFENRLDIDWKKRCICTFVFWDSDQQRERFENIWPGDRIVLKKRQQFGKTMRLYGHGRVTGVKYDSEDRRYLTVDWSAQDEVIEVPLMGCNSTVDTRSIERVQEEMPEEFFESLDGKSRERAGR